MTGERSNDHADEQQAKPYVHETCMKSRIMIAKTDKDDGNSEMAFVLVMLVVSVVVFLAIRNYEK